MSNGMAQYQFSNGELKELKELLLVAKTRGTPEGLTAVTSDKHIQTINQILADRSK